MPLTTRIGDSDRWGLSLTGWCAVAGDASAAGPDGDRAGLRRPGALLDFQGGGGGGGGGGGSSVGGSSGGGGGGGGGGGVGGSGGGGGGGGGDGGDSPDAGREGAGAGDGQGGFWDAERLPGTPRMEAGPAGGRGLDRTRLRTAAKRATQTGGAEGSVGRWGGAAAWRADGADDGSVVEGDVSGASFLQDYPAAAAVAVSGAGMGRLDPAGGGGRRGQGPPPALPGAAEDSGAEERRAPLTPSREFRPAAAAARRRPLVGDGGGAADAYATPRMPAAAE